MISHDLAFETLAKAPVKRIDVQITRQIQDPSVGYVNDVTLKWTSSDVLMSCNVDAVGSFLGTTTKKAVAKLLGIVTTATSGDLLKVELGVYNADPSVAGFDYLCEGYFLVDTVAYDYDAGSTTVTMYDHMWTAQNTTYTDTEQSSGFTYPTTVAGLAQQMAGALGVDLMAGFASLPNASYNILVDPYATISSATLATVIGEIAQATGTSARISGTTLTFSQFSVSSEQLDSSVLKTLKIGKEYGPVTSVILGRVPQNDNVVISNTAPASNTISSINTTTNLITITANGMVDGNLVQVQSTGTLPAPLQANTNYYVYTGGNANTFALSDTYAHALAGTNLIDLTTAGTGTITLSHLETQEVQINNNQIVDDDRQTLLPPLYSALVGIGWNQVTANTIGLGWHEVGDVIQYVQDSTVVNAFINEIHLVLAGSIKEQLVTIVPDVATINYQTAGGILKSIYNTEIKVDKQENEITSVVEEQDTFEGQTTDNFTEVYQNLTDIILTVQKAGGGNLLLNSVGFATDSATDNASVTYDKLSFWDYNPSYQISTHGTIRSFTSGESLNAGGISGEVIEMVGPTIYMTQRVNVAVGAPLSFGIRVNNAISSGDVTITLSNPNDTFTIFIDDVSQYIWDEFTLENFTPTVNYLDVKIAATTSLTRFQFTDLRLLYGSTLGAWVQSQQEILATNVQFTKLGMKIFDNVHDTNTQVTYNEFSTRRKSDNKILFEADDTGVITNDLSVHGSTIFYDPSGIALIKQVTIPSNSALGGIAFVRVS